MVKIKIGKKGIMWEQILLWALVFVAILIVIFIFKDSWQALIQQPEALTAQAQQLG